MTSTSEAMGRTPSVAVASRATTVRPFLWSVRRELWEHGSIYIAPPVVGVLVVVAAVIGALRRGRVSVTYSGDAPVEMAILLPFAIAAGAIVLVGALTGIFYCLAALNHERRDRSILFWKSLPVSNVTTVLAKVFTAMVVLPVSVFVAAVVTHLVLLVIAAGNLVGHGESLDTLADLPLLRVWLLLAWVLLSSWLWWAPIWGWALLASAWAKRLPLLWAILPPIGLIVFDRLAFDGWHVGHIVRDRLRGGWAAAFKFPPDFHPELNHHINLPDPDVAGFFSRPELWLGFLFAALCIAAAVWLRRRAEPV